MKKKIRQFYKRFVSQIIQFRPHNLLGSVRYVKQAHRYQALGGSIHTWRPMLGEDTPTTAIDSHYFHQAIWTARHIASERPAQHTDVGSQVNFVGQLTAITKVRFVDLRPIHTTITDLDIIRGSVLALPFADRSVPSLSCLHVAEHIGLGRYGDPLDPHGTHKACAELSRVLATGGSLYFSLPIGRERTEFNAHRIHYPSTILKYFPDLKLIEFSAVDDQGHFIPHADIQTFDNARYACGFFRFTREEKKS